MKSLGVVALMVLAASPCAALAQDDLHPSIESRYLLDVGVSFPEPNIRLGAGVSAPGAGIDGTSWTGNVDLVYKGPFAFVSFFW
jgi:hypothetical protein